MRNDYELWLRRTNYDEATIGAQIYRVLRVEYYYGDLDHHFDQDECRAVLSELSYSTADERSGNPNRSKLPITGNIRSNLASYRSAVSLYRKFRGRSHDLHEASKSAVSLRVTNQKFTFGRPPTLSDFNLDGFAAFEALISASSYQNALQAIASLTVFSHPDTVRQTNGHALFPTIRRQKAVGQFDSLDGRRVMFDDNKSATDAFLWSNGISRRGRDTQINHIYSSSHDVDAYTALPNICMTPSFIAKLTDTHASVRALLRYRSFELYGWTPTGTDEPLRPEAYDQLTWAPPLDPIENLSENLKLLMSKKPKDRTVQAAMKLGWLFGAPSLSPFERI